MKVQLSEHYVLQSDSLCMWIDKISTNKQTGEPVFTKFAGYAQNFEQLFQSFARKRIRTAEAKNVLDILESISNAAAEVEQMAQAIGAELDKRG